MKTTGFLVLASTALVFTADARAAAPPTRVVDQPCTGCRAVVPKVEGSTKVPLLVVMHGDWGVTAADLLSAWERHALKRDMAVLSLQCPKDLGCKGSWWRWNGDPAWVTTQVDTLAAKHPSVDRERIYLAGWSGGATYMGMHAQSFQRSFAALVYHGGGHPPFGGCVQGGGAPVAFLVGSGNPLHSLAVDLRAYHDGCKDEVLWKLIPKADHPQEWSALDSNGGALVEWMLKKKMKPAISPAPPT